MRLRPLRTPRPRRRRWACAIGAAFAACALVLTWTVGTAGASSAPLENGVSGPAGSWVVLPMGQLSEEDNTFWQMLRAPTGSSHWSVVTPPGVADNGGLVAALGGGSVLVGFLPSQLLRFSPLSLSDDDGQSWHAEFLPDALARIPDALAYDTDAVGSGRSGATGALAVVGGRRVLAAGPGLSSWVRLASLAGLRRASPNCRASSVSAVAFSATGVPMVAVDCAGRAEVGIFAHGPSGWQAVGPRLHGTLSQATTDVLRLQPVASTAAALVEATRGSRHLLVVLWQAGSGWSTSEPLALAPGQSVRATAVSSGGTLGVLEQTRAGVVATAITPGGSWVRLPPLPSDTAALAPVASGTSSPASLFDAFAAEGTVLSIYALSPAGSRWVPVQTIRVPLAYGSSS